ncbi:MAG TPA: UDP-N-acetylglucosamine 1-carboxyvinyltransferase [Spirochaetota bacterium]|nr:UDP-N-acetylglucosamine 1-carboxyvinyltransferase [Spirochaetota bacterium]
MKKYIVKGGKELNGRVKISGSKNAALPVLAATLLTDDTVTLHNIPILRDTQTMFSLLAVLGKKVIINNGAVVIKTEKKNRYKATYDIVKQMRASIVVLGPLLAKRRKAHVSLPGGCAFGPRPVDLHIKGLRKLDARITFHHGYIDARASRLQGNEINLAGEFGSSVLATDNVIMAASLADGKTVIESAAREPETQDLINFLKAMGADISGSGTSVVTVNGVSRLHGCEYTVISDRIEAGTFLGLAALNKKEIKIRFEQQQHIENILDLLKEIGVKITTKGNWISVKGGRANKYKNFKVTTLPYPDFPTDMQAVMTVVASFIPGICTISENIYPNRFNHVPELNRMGANIRIEKNTAIIHQASSLEGASVQASDLRAGAALVIAALKAQGTSEVRRIYHIERGYEDFHKKLKTLGADIDVGSDSLI